MVIAWIIIDGILVDHIASKVKGTFFGYKE